MKKFIEKKFFVILIVILLTAAFLRFWRTGSNPPSLTWDETAWGYNAYTLGMDGKDEFGRSWPVQYLESFGDFKPPVYAYLDIIPVKVFGLNEFSTRFPSALFGTLTVLVTFFLVKRLFNKSENATQYALLSSLVLAFSPWHIMLSRAAFEANVATFFLVSGVWAFLAGVQERGRFLIISAISFALSMYTFNTSRVFTPLIVLVLVIAFGSRLLKIKKETLIAATLGLLIFLPIFGFLLSPQASLRFREVNIFSNIDIIKTANQEILNDNGSLFSKLIHNRRVLFATEYLVHYFDNLNPLFLFTRGDGNPKFSIQSVGQMYLWESAFLVIGTLFLFRKREGNWWIIPVWLLIGIVPAATARETPHALRIETTLPTFQIVVAYGLFQVLSLLGRLKLKVMSLKINMVIFILFLGICIFNFLYFAHQYFNQYPYEFSSEWQYGYKESIVYAASVEKKYDEIYVTSNLGRPYIYYLFYNQVDPAFFRKTAKIARDPFGFVKVLSYGKYRFPENFVYAKEKNKKILYIGTPYDIPTGAKILKTFKLLDGNPVLIAYE